MDTQRNESLNAWGADKVKRYGWAPLDQMGEFRMLHKGLLKLCPDYQRDQTVQKVIDFASDWKWVAVGALVVAERNGEFWVMDGGHRTSAAMRRSDITHLPCMVFQTVSVQTEAVAFLALNTSRKPVTAIAKQKALVTSGNRVASYVQEQFDRLGLVVRPSPRAAGQIKCVAWAVRRAEEDPAVFATVLEVGTALSNQDNVWVQEKLLEALWFVNARCGDGLNDPRLLRRLKEKGAKALLAAINRASAYYAAGGARIWASGLIDEVNKGLRTKFDFDGKGDFDTTT